MPKRHRVQTTTGGATETVTTDVSSGWKLWASNNVFRINQSGFRKLLQCSVFCLWHLVGPDPPLYSEGGITGSSSGLPSKHRLSRCPTGLRSWPPSSIQHVLHSNCNTVVCLRSLVGPNWTLLWLGVTVNNVIEIYILVYLPTIMTSHLINYSFYPSFHIFIYIFQLFLCENP